MDVESYNTSELLCRLWEDWRELIRRRREASGPDREEIDQVYNRLIGYVAKIEKARVKHDINLLGLVATAGTILDEYLRQPER